MRPFSIYSGALDANTRSYHRFGELGGALTGLVGGPTFANHGATPEDDGYRFVRAEGDYMDAALDGGARMAGTLECWIRDYGNPGVDYGMLITWFDAAHHYFRVYCYWRADPPLYRIQGRFRDAAGVSRFVTGEGAAVEALLTGLEPFHVAVTFCCDPQERMQLFVNGNRYPGDWSGTAGFSPTTLRLGRERTGDAADDFDGVLDEVRVSEVVRYDADFPITRFGEGRRVLKRGPGTEAGLCAGTIGG